MQHRNFTIATLLTAIILPLGIASAGDSKTKEAPRDEIADEDVGDADSPDVDESRDSRGDDVIVGGGDGEVETIVHCWCEGGANGNGPAACEAPFCNSSAADSCCALAYGDGACAYD